MTPEGTGAGADLIATSPPEFLFGEGKHTTNLASINMT